MKPLSPPTPTPPPTLVALTPGEAARTGIGPLVRTVGAALEGGLRGVLLREPELEDGATLELARRLAELLAGVDGWLGVHDRAHLVGVSGAAAVHLGWRSLPVAEARSVVGEDVAIGVSTHAGDGAPVWSAADYLFHGPLFETPSKRGLADPVGLVGLARWCAAVELPTWAIGGLRPEHAAALRDAGAAGMAVLGGILGSARPASAARAYLAALER